MVLRKRKRRGHTKRQGDQHGGKTCAIRQQAMDSKLRITAYFVSTNLVGWSSSLLQLDSFLHVFHFTRTQTTNCQLQRDNALNASTANHYSRLLSRCPTQCLNSEHKARGKPERSRLACWRANMNMHEGMQPREHRLFYRVSNTRRIKNKPEFLRVSCLINYL
jgi:hypothetical protein